MTKVTIAAEVTINMNRNTFMLNKTPNLVVQNIFHVGIREIVNNPPVMVRMMIPTQPRINSPLGRPFAA